MLPAGLRAQVNRMQGNWTNQGWEVIHVLFVYLFFCCAGEKNSRYAVNDGYVCLFDGLLFFIMDMLLQAAFVVCEMHLTSLAFSLMPTLYMCFKMAIYHIVMYLLGGICFLLFVRAVNPGAAAGWRV